jgi:hypothetical protein
LEAILRRRINADYGSIDIKGLSKAERIAYDTGGEKAYRARKKAEFEAEWKVLKQV